jgi:non-canonical (house-cleaning) NTP pyrophosphatase
VAQNLEDFWQRFEGGIQVAVGDDLPDKLLGVREGFLRYFDGLERATPMIFKPFRQQHQARAALPLNDEEILQLACQRSRQLECEEAPDCGFFVASEAGLTTVCSGKETRHFVRTWTVVAALGNEAWGSSGSVQLPEGLKDAEVSFAIPGRRRSGGMVSSLTSGGEHRRSATALATFHAVSTLMYGLIESRS